MAEFNKLLTIKLAYQNRQIIVRPCSISSVCKTLKLSSIGTLSYKKSMTFSFKGKRYIYRLTRQLYLHAKKVQVDFVIVPSNAYHLKLKSFGWYLESLQKIKFKTVLGKDEKICKAICEIFPKCQNLNTKWQIWKQAGLTEKEINSNLNKCIADKQQQAQLSKAQVNELTQKDNHLDNLPSASWFNNPAQTYSLFFPQYGTSIVMANQTSIHLINAEQKILRVIQSFLIPLQRIQSLFLTIFQMHTFLGFLQLFMNLKQFSVITSIEIYQKLKQCMFQFFKVSEQMLMRRCSIRILTQKSNLLFRKMKLSFEDGLSQSLKISFDKQYVKIFSKQIEYYPKQLQQNQLVFLILYSVSPTYKETFQTIPECFRRKIVLSRPTHKYNNKYFCILNDKKQGNSRQIMCKRIFKANQNVPLWLQQINFSQYISIKTLKDKQRINASKRVVKVQAGCLIGQQSNKVYLQGAQIANEQFLRCYKNARILLIDEHQYLMIKRSSQSNRQLKSKDENKFKAISQQNSLLNLLKQNQLDMLSSIAKPNSYESGETIDLSQKKNQKVFFVLKGSMKWQGIQHFATKGFFIGNIEQYATKNAIYGDISVLKDTWVLEVKLTDFFDYFLVENPQVMIDMLSRGIVFN